MSDTGYDTGYDRDEILERQAVALERIAVALEGLSNPVPRAEGDTHNVDLCKFMDRMTLVRRAGKAVSEEEKVR